MRRLYLVVLLLAVYQVSSAAVGDWKTFTSMRSIHQLTMHDSLVWCATSGGVLQYNTVTQEFANFTNTEGLDQIDIDAIAYDANGFLWIGMNSGMLQFMDLQTGEWGSYLEFKNQLTINYILPIDEIILVATDKGIAELRLDDKNRWERTWKADIGAASQIMIAQDYIWVAQEDGLRRIEYDFPNKQVPNAWQHFTIFDGMPANNIQALFEYNDMIVVGTENGVGFYDGAAWYGPERSEISFLHFVEWQGELACATSGGLFVRSINGTWTRKGPRITNFNGVIADIQGKLLATTINDGIMEFSEQDTAWFSHIVNGPGSNIAKDMVFDKDRWLWVANMAEGISVYNGKNWQSFALRLNYPYETEPHIVDFRCLEVDQYNRVWAGTWGHGVVMFEKTDNDSIVYTYLGNMDDQLGAYDLQNGYTVVTDIVNDSKGNLWFAVYAPKNAEVLAVYDMVDQWQHWTRADGILSSSINQISEGYKGWIWIATDAGVSVLNYNNTLFDKSDDDLSGTLTTSDGFNNNECKTVAVDLDNQMWLGTTDGLFYWFGQANFRQNYNVINDNTTMVHVDKVNNKWIGSSAGLTLLTSNNRYSYYSLSNSKIVSNQINCFAMDKKTGDLYIGTPNGISMLETFYTEPYRNLSFVKGYPNPFVIKDSFSEFFIDNLAYNSVVKIFTPDGFLVKTFSSDVLQGARVSWDGRNNNGEYVASGIYVYVVTIENGDQASGKIAVVR